MKVIVRAGEVQIQLTGVTLTNRQLRDLVKLRWRNSRNFAHARY